ncbi:MAG: HlyD family type I secretion periplasmic adaptor subunit [Gallionella sp.]|nr:HlyD family type I secretion periplasmic adaptor subunit [Gallionella sp.]
MFFKKRLFFKKKEAHQKPESPIQPPLGSRERSLLAESVHIEEELVPAFVRPILYLVAALVLIFILWSALTRMKEVARAPGEVIPSGSVKVVQHLDGGVVAEIVAEERKLVEQGAVLLRIDGTQAHADYGQMKARLDSLRLREERLKAFTEDKTPNFAALGIAQPGMVSNQMEIYITQLDTMDSTLAILDRQIDQRKQRIRQLEMALSTAKEHQSLTGELAEMRENLASRQLINKTVLLETRRAKVTASGEIARLKEEIGVAGNELAEMRSRRLDTQNQLLRDALAELGVVRAEKAEVEETIQRLQGRVDRLEVRAPIRGYVLDMRVQNVGQVVQPGALLMQVVSDNAVMEAEVRISPRDIGFVRVGQPVNLRVTSYDYSRFGFVKGSLKRVSASSMVGENKTSYFQGLVELNNPYVGDVPGRNLLQPGMNVEAEILTGEKTLLAYLVKPLIDVVSMSFNER